MSWDAYIKQMMDKQGVQHAAIFGYSGTTLSKWCGSDGFEPLVDEVQTFSLPESGIRSKGVFIGGHKYIMLRYEVDDEKHITNIHLKKSKKDDCDVACNATVCKTTKAFIIIQGTPEANGGQLCTAASCTGEYLAKSGF